MCVRVFMTAFCVVYDGSAVRAFLIAVEFHLMTSMCLQVHTQIVLSCRS